MDYSLVYGRLKIPPTNFTWDFRSVKELVTVTSEPKLKKELTDDHVTFWSVEFTCPRERWREIEPELTKMGIEVNLYDAMPDRHESVVAAEKAELRRIDEKFKRQLVQLAGIVLTVAGFAYLVLEGSTSISCSLLAIGVVMTALGGTLLGRLDERTREARAARKRL